MSKNNDRDCNSCNNFNGTCILEKDGCQTSMFECYSEPYFKNLNAFDENTSPCNGYKGCLYKQQGRCIYNIAPIQVRSSKACYYDELDCEDGWC